MSVTTHERPGVYSEYDASSVVQGRQGRKMVGMAAIHATAPAGVPQTVTSYESALIAFGSTGGQDMTELIRLALKNGAAGVVAVPVADEEGYEAAFAALAAMDDIGVVICDSVDREVQQSLRDSAAAASAARRERIAVAAGGAGETVTELLERAKALNSERVVLVAPGGTDEEGKAVSGLSLAAAVAGAIAGTTDPALPLGGEGDGPRALPPGGEHVPTGEAAGDDGHKLCRPGHLAFHVLQQQPAAAGIVQPLAAVAGGVHPRRSVQRVHAQA